MRGTRVVVSGECPVFGIIPAYAGNTHSRLTTRERDWDHPRVCGEHEQGARQFGYGRGSSPRMRGTLNKTLDDLEKQGIIPAYAGNTIFYRGNECPMGDHPRVCGEHHGSHLSVLFS